MATIRFYTRSKVNKLVPVYIYFQDGLDLKIRFATPYKIFPSYWSEKKQGLKPNILFSGEFTRDQAKDIEDKFTQLKDSILREYYKLSGPVTDSWLREVVDKFYYKEAPSTETLNQYIKRFIDEANSGKRLANTGNSKKRYSQSSIRNLNDFRTSFNLFQGIEPEPRLNKDGKEIKRRNAKEYPKQPYKPLNFHDISVDTYNEFIQYYYSRDCGANYIGKHIKSFKTIMRQAREEGLHNNMEIERKAFKTISEEVDHIYLTEAELKSIFGLDLSDNKHLADIRDVFLTGCYTAQRFSDYSKINESNFKVKDGNMTIELIQKKTGEKCIIPVRPELEVILKRHNYTLPKTFEQKVNEGIKKIGERAKITELINVEQNKGGLKVKTSVKKCSLIQTHTARRTGCSLMYLAGIPVIDIMKISGHRTTKEFLKYVRISKEETALKLANHPYFKSKLKIV
jgi:hypothetical protein